MCDNLGRYTTPFGGCEWAQGAEVIVCGGSINSPQLLQVSGIGDPLLLQNSGIRTAHELRGVGQNLQDHLEVQRAQDDAVCVCVCLRARAQRSAEKLLIHAETSSNSTLNL
jgi:choline dehydrogenase-like flavoprotein